MNNPEIYRDLLVAVFGGVASLFLKWLWSSIISPGIENSAVSMRNFEFHDKRKRLRNHQTLSDRPSPDFTI